MKPTLTIWGKFRVAIRGIYFGVKGQTSFVFHFIAIVAVFALGIALRIDMTSWGLVILSIGLVIAAELINSAIETLFRALPAEVQSKGWPALDIAAGAVLVASLLAACVGGLVFIPRLLSLF